MYFEMYSIWRMSGFEPVTRRLSLHTGTAEVEFLNSEELSLIKSSPLPAQLPGPGMS